MRGNCHNFANFLACDRYFPDQNTHVQKKKRQSQVYLNECAIATDLVLVDTKNSNGNDEKDDGK